MVLGYIASIEEISALLILREMKSDAQGLFWVLKERK
jgi:hypothetical protein